MAERVVRVTLKAVVSDYETAMRNAANATHTVGTEAEKLAQQKQVFQQLGATGLTMGALLSTGLALATKASLDFDAQMSNVKAATHETAGNMDLLRQAALDAGESTVFSATQAAGAIEELAKAGVSTADILGGGLTGALDLAAAGGLDVATAAGIAATALQQFNLDGADMAHVADLLAAGSGKAMGDVTDLAQALNQSALVAKQTGLSIEETTAGLSAFAAAGLLGSDAGTSFKSMLQALNPTSAQAAELMEKYNLQAYDAQGNFVGLSEYAGKLKAGLSGLSTEQQNATLKTIFGADAVRAATVLYQQGAEGIDEWTEAVDDQGYAADTARLRLDNLKGDVEALGGAFETALIDTGSTANDTLRTMVQALTGLIGMYNDLPEPVQATTMAIGGAAAAVALTTGSTLIAIPKWIAFKTTIEASQLSMKGIGLAAGGAGLALTGLFLIVGQLAAEHAAAQARARDYAEAIKAGGTAAEKFVAEQLAMKDSFLWIDRGSATENAKKLGISLEEVTAAVKGGSSEFEAFKEHVSRAYSEAGKTLDAGYAMEQLTNKVTALRDAEQEAHRQISDTASAQSSLSDSAQESASSAGRAADAYVNQADAVADLNSQLTDLIDKINAANGVAVDAITANANYRSALAGIADEVQRQKDAYEEANGTLEGFSLSLDENTASGSANAASLSDVSSKARDAAAAQFEQDLATMSADDAAKKYADTLALQKQSFIDSATAAGYNADQVKALADRIFQMPDKKTFDMLVETAAAQNAIDKFITLNDGKRVKVHVDVEGNQSFNVGGRTVSGFSKGGPVRGPGTSTSDSIDAKLSDGEYVLTADDVQRAGGTSAVDAWRAMLTGNRPAVEQPYVVAAPDSEAVYMEVSTKHEPAMRGAWS